MFRPRTMFIFIVLNVFAVLFASVLLEYINLSERFQTLDNTMSAALDSAIATATGSEEMFSDDYNSFVASYSMLKNNKGSKNKTFSTTLLWGEDKFYQLNSYKLAKYYEENGRLPITSVDMNSVNSIAVGGAGRSADEAEYFFEWLYAPTGSDYNNASLEWANRNYNTKQMYDDPALHIEAGRNDGDGKRNQDFFDYYENVGNRQQTVGYLKVRNTDRTSFGLQAMTYPTLMNMGFSWMENQGGSISCDENSSVTQDNFASSVKVGKNSLTQRNSKYYLTPMSLGVTYVPVEVLKPVLMANIDTIVRLNKLASSNGYDFTATGDDVPNATETMKQASECIPVNVYTGSMNAQAKHVVDSSERIVQDGMIEYDLNSLKVKVDYFFVDFTDGGALPADDKRLILIDKLQGCLSYAQVNGYGSSNSVSFAGMSGMGASGNTVTELRKKTLTAFNNQDSAVQASANGGESIYSQDSEYRNQYNKVRNGRIVARISARIRIHAPYQSSILQWVCEKIGAPYKGHYDVKLYNGDGNTDGIWQNSNGVWYQYTTYYMQSRV